MSPDSELIGAYVTDRSEAAFRALVARHANLVYATALRQVGDSGMAEEITQNVFVILAKKAPRLGSIETLAGWLHRTAVLESKGRIRAEIRRRKREEIAATLTAMQHEGESTMEALTPLIDEALLHLRDSDRLALMLRFFENNSLREVGIALGVDEDAARKRVSRALARVTEFFRARGFGAVVAGGMAAMLTSSAKAAPAVLINSAAKAGFTAGAATGISNLLYFRLMNLGALKAAAVLVFVVSTPLIWQSQVHARIGTEQIDLAGKIAAANKDLETLEQRTRRTQEQSSRVQAQSQQAQSRFIALNRQRTGKAPAEYQWDDNSPYMRVPKEGLQTLPSPFDSSRDKKLNDINRELLQMTDAEASEVEDAFRRFIQDYYSLLGQKAHYVEATKDDCWGHKLEETRVFEVDGMEEEVKQLRESLFARFNSILGNERGALFRGSLRDWMSTDDERFGVNSTRPILEFKHRRRFYKPTPGAARFDCGLSCKMSSYSSTSMPIDDLPPVYAARLQDWIAIATSKPKKP